MKTLIVMFAVCTISLWCSAQKLVDVYQSGIVKLVADENFAAGNDWNNVFSSFNDSLYGKHVGARKSLKILPDESVVVSHAYRDFYSMFSGNGTFQKEMKIINESGNPFKRANAIEGIINNRIFYTGLDNMGKSLCFDFNGKYQKTLVLDYMTRQMIPLPNGKIAVVGWVIWSDRFRDFVSIVDYETNQETVIWEHFTIKNDRKEGNSLFNYSYIFKQRGACSINTMPYTKNIGMPSPPVIASVKDRIIIANPVTAELLIFDLNGNKVGSDQITWGKNIISVEEQIKIQKEAIEKYKNIENPTFAGWVSEEENREANAYFIKAMEADLNKISKPISLPVFATVIKDSDDNLLFFEFPEKEGNNKFNVWVYNTTGKFVCQSSFVCEDYQLEITPSKMVFHKGYIYGLQKRKRVDGVPLRLVRFKIVNK